jgi:predicted MFS family arabinose efflux permease
MILFDVLTLFFHSLATFTTIRFFSGLGGGAAQAAAAAAIARLAHSDKGYGIYVGFQFVLPAIALFGFPALLPDIGFNGMIQILIALEVICLALVPIFTNYKLPAHSRNAEAESEVLEIGLIQQKPALLSIIAFCVYGAANAGIWAYAERIGINAGLGNKGTDNVLAVVNALAFFGAFLVIWLQDRWGHVRPLSVGIACQLAAMLLLIGFSSPIGFSLSMGLFTIAWAFAWPYFLSIQADIDHTGTVVVAGQFSNLVGNSMGPAMAAFLIGGGVYVSAIWLACGLLVASLLLILAIPRSKAPQASV